MATEDKGVEWGNVPQWISAICALALAALAIYGLFFSTASQALVAYLQSELAVRNERIAALELREGELKLSVKNSEASLIGLSEQKAAAQQQVAQLNAEQLALSQKLNDLRATLSTTEFSLVKEKIGAKLSSTVVSQVNMFTELDLYEKDGVKAKTERPWDGHLAFVQQAAEKFEEKDRPVAREVVANFIKQCDRFGKVTIHIPSLKIPRDADMSAYNFDRSKHPYAIRLELLINQIEKTQKDIVGCFNSVTQ